MKRLCVALAATFAAVPQAASPPRVPGPFDARASVPALRYESALSAYRADAEAKPVPWTTVNEEVAGAGHGTHMEHAPAKSAAPAKPAPADKPAEPAKSAPPAHRHH